MSWARPNHRGAERTLATRQISPRIPAGVAGPRRGEHRRRRTTASMNRRSGPGNVQRRTGRKTSSEEVGSAGYPRGETRVGGSGGRRRDVTASRSSSSVGGRGPRDIAHGTTESEMWWRKRSLPPRPRRGTVRPLGMWRARDHPHPRSREREGAESVGNQRGASRDVGRAVQRAGDRPLVRSPERGMRSVIHTNVIAVATGGGAVPRVKLVAHVVRGGYPDVAGQDGIERPADRRRHPALREPNARRLSPRVHPGVGASGADNRRRDPQRRPSADSSSPCPSVRRAVCSRRTRRIY